jgi:hypothetical protein
MTANSQVVLVGGPRDGAVVEAGSPGLLEVEVGGMMHRYIPTKQTRPVDGADLPAYNYDGMVNPAGAEDGVENAEKRMASPRAEEENL